MLFVGVWSFYHYISAGEKPIIPCPRHDCRSVRMPALLQFRIHQKQQPWHDPPSPHTICIVVRMQRLGQLYRRNLNVQNPPAARLWTARCPTLSHLLSVCGVDEPNCHCHERFCDGTIVRIEWQQQHFHLVVGNPNLHPPKFILFRSGHHPHNVQTARRREDSSNWTRSR